MTGNIQSRRYELMVHQIADVKEFRELSDSRGSVVVKALYAISRTVAGSTPDEVTKFFNLPNASGRTRLWGSLSL
jgi:hypothetical protein